MPTKITHVLAVGLIFTLLQGCGEVYAPKTGVEVSSLEAKAPEAEGEARQNHEDGTKETSVLANKEPSQEPSEEVISHEDRDIDSDSHSNATEVAAVSTVDSDAKADGVSEGEVVASEQTPEETSTVGRDGGEGEEEFDDDPYGLLGGESSGEDDFQDDPFGLLGDDEGNEQESDDHAAKQENKLIIDPLEGLNKALFAFGRAVDYAILGPYTTILYAMLPTFVIDRIVDVTAILNMPSSSVQLLLQGQPKLAAHRFGRFIGSVVGGKGIVDAEFSRGIKLRISGKPLQPRGLERVFTFPVRTGFL